MGLLEPRHLSGFGAGRGESGGRRGYHGSDHGSNRRGLPRDRRDPGRMADRAREAGAGGRFRRASGDARPWLSRVFSVPRTLPVPLKPEGAPEVELMWAFVLRLRTGIV